MKIWTRENFPLYGIYTHTHTQYTHTQYTHTQNTHTHTPAPAPTPRSITQDMVVASGSANPLSVNFTITYVSESPYYRLVPMQACKEFTPYRPGNEYKSLSESCTSILVKLYTTQELIKKNIKNVEGCRDDMPNSMQTR